jgi:hypothetical protein
MLIASYFPLCTSIFYKCLDMISSSSIHSDRSQFSLCCWYNQSHCMHNSIVYTYLVTSSVTAYWTLLLPCLLSQRHRHLLKIMFHTDTQFVSSQLCIYVLSPTYWQSLPWRYRLWRTLAGWAATAGSLSHHFCLWFSQILWHSSVNN